MSIHDYTRALVGGDWSIRIPLLSLETKAALPGKTFTLRAKDVDVRFVFDDVLTGAEVTTLNTTVTNHIAAGPYVPPRSQPRQNFRMRSPNGSKFRISVNNAGSLVVTPI